MQGMSVLDTPLVTLMSGNVIIHFNIKFMHSRHNSCTLNRFLQLVFDSCMYESASLMHRTFVSLPAGQSLHIDLVSEILTKVPRGHGRSLEPLSL